mgnify:CR=1 FL=1
MIRKSIWRRLRSELLFFASLFSIFTIFGTTAYGMYYIPSESMLPTLAVGDRIAVNKFVYGYSRYSTPFSIGPELSTPTGRVFGRAPERGEIVVFKHPVTRQTYIKRVIGLPGDEIMLENGRLYINGELTPRAMEDAYRYREHRGDIAAVGRFLEDLPDGRTHGILERGDNTYADNFGPVIVPDSSLFVMGDNRDNSMDSRFENPGVGLLPMEFLVGRADYIVASTNIGNAEKGLKKHKSKWFSKLQ